MDSFTIQIKLRQYLLLNKLICKNQKKGGVFHGFQSKHQHLVLWDPKPSTAVLPFFNLLWLSYWTKLTHIGHITISWLICWTKLIHTGHITILWLDYWTKLRHIGHKKELMQYAYISIKIGHITKKELEQTQLRTNIHKMLWRLSNLNMVYKNNNKL